MRSRVIVYCVMYTDATTYQARPRRLLRHDSRLRIAHSMYSCFFHSEENSVFAREGEAKAVLIHLREETALGSEVHGHSLTSRDVHSLKAKELLQGCSVLSSARRN